MHLIGLTGYAGAGKDTFAGALREVRPPGTPFFSVAFADPMRRMLEALGVPVDYMSDRALKEVPVPGIGYSYRRLAQTLGTEWGRALGDNFWVDLAATRINWLRDERALVVITDVRFPNEVGWLKGQGGYLVRINRDGLAPVVKHASEDHVASFFPDFEIDNNQDIELLSDKARWLLGQLHI